MQQLLLLVAFLLPAGAWAGEIIGGQEAQPHSHPYMAYLLTRTPTGLSTCGGFLVREDFVMTSARCWGSRMRVILGAHNIRRQERTQQSILVLRAIRHPRYNQQNHLNDIMLLQGDTGGPLVCNNVAQGIVSYGRRFGAPPTVFTRIARFLPWINRTMSQLNQKRAH
ncbi:cathepsin G-like [Eptesicus fuscus]|uniref:cathepsin G-like n=1 Tax=Eptesicus fuscus TaxID=29078 RepID=UPI002403F39D|nr:cathepsin G-like [Eptesicus fuscus]